MAQDATRRYDVAPVRRRVEKLEILVKDLKKTNEFLRRWCRDHDRAIEKLMKKVR